MSRTPRAWPRQDGGGGASAPTSRSPSGPPSRVAARPQQARVRPPSRPPPWGRSTGRRRTEASQAARATAPEAQGAARSVRCHCADASHPGPRGHGRCIERGVAQSSAAQSSSPRRHPRSCAPALTTRSPGSAASRSDPGPTGASLPDPRRSDDQQPAPWLASATHGASAYPLINNPGILNPSPSPGPRITLGTPLFGFDGEKGALQGREITDLLARNLLGVGHHGLHKGRPLGAKLLNHRGILGYRGGVVIHRAALSDGALPNPPAAFWQQRTVLSCANAEFYNCYPWGAVFCTLSAARRMDGSPALPW